jgi:predicted O-methyltransferase YrrM
MPAMLSRKKLAAALGASALVFGLSLAVSELAGRFALPLIATAACLGVLLLAFLIDRRNGDRIADARVQNEAVVALYHALRPGAPLPPMHDYAIAPDSALLLHALVRETSPQVVVETGSGVSTLVIAYTLKALGKGTLISLELDENYARRTRDEVARHGLADRVTVVHAPLRDVVVDGQPYRWHDPSALDEVPAIDLVFDDGPPLYVGRGLRYAALPILEPKLGPGAVYVINYVAAEERGNVARWLARDPKLRAEWHQTQKGNVILRRG